MKAFLRLLVGIGLLAVTDFPAEAAFTSLYVFGDGVSTTTNNTEPSVAYLYYGHRFCNGRVWVEVLSERQGLPYEQNKNWSYFGHYSADLVTNISRFDAPTDANTALFVVWVSDADFVYALNHIDPPYTTNRSLAAWTNAINRSLANHQQAIQMLYARGARTLLMPNAVDISKVPYYAYLEPADARFVRERVIDFNTGFAALLNQARASLSDLTIYVPDYFAMLDNLAAHPADYGLVHPGVDAVDDPSLTDWSLNGPGTNYLFWDYLDPTAMVQMIMAEIAQQLISPVNIGQLSLTANDERGTAEDAGTRGRGDAERGTAEAFGAGSARLALANLPIGRKGFVDATTNFVNWTSVQSIDSSNAFEDVFVPAAGPRQFYRLRFPFAWTWP